MFSITKRGVRPPRRNRLNGSCRNATESAMTGIRSAGPGVRPDPEDPSIRSRRRRRGGPSSIAIKTRMPADIETR